MPSRSSALIPFGSIFTGTVIVRAKLPATRSRRWMLTPSPYATDLLPEIAIVFSFGLNFEIAFRYTRQFHDGDKVVALLEHVNRGGKRLCPEVASSNHSLLRRPSSSRCKRNSASKGSASPAIMAGPP